MERPKLNRVWASGEDSEIKDPGDSKYEEGWVAEIPTYQVLNYLQNKVDKTLLSLGERGIFEWGSDVSYKLNSLVWNEVDGKIYVSLIDNPDTSLTPDTNPTQWEKSSVQITRSEFDELNTKITDHINSLGGTNPHQLEPHDVDTYSRSEIDSMVNEDSDANAAHIANMNNPHGTTAEKAGAVSVEGGEYTGTVTMGSGVTNLDSTGNSKIDSTGDVLGIVVGTSGLGVDSTGTPGILNGGVFTPFGTVATHDEGDFLSTSGGQLDDRVNSVVDQGFIQNAPWVDASGNGTNYINSGFPIWLDGDSTNSFYTVRGRVTNAYEYAQIVLGAPAGNQTLEMQSTGQILFNGASLMSTASALATFVQDMAYGAIVQSGAINNNQTYIVPAGCVGCGVDKGDPNLHSVWYKPTQKLVNGAWITIAG